MTLIHDITGKLNAAYAAEEAFWKQRSRLLWIKLGDRNTGFFHATTKNRKRANTFYVIENKDGKFLFKEEEIAKIIVSYFDDIFTSTESLGDREATVRYALKPMIKEADNNKLIEIPSPQEIREAMFSIHADKAPGPDGFSASFFQAHWEDVGDDIVREVQGYFISGSLGQD